MLKISINENESLIGFTLAGRLAGPWVEELSRTWSETAPRLGSKSVQFDLRELTYSDPAGTRLLRGIYAATRARLVASSVWSQHFAEEIRNLNGNMNGNGTKGVANGLA